MCGSVSKKRLTTKKGAKKSPHYKGQLSDPKGPADVHTIQNDNKDIKKNPIFRVRRMSSNPQLG